MNYHHIYHAGNFADVFKHIILCFCLEKFHEKPTPFFVLDTHSGIGKYDLADEKSLKTSESLNGIIKILAQKNFSEILPPRYLKILAKINRCDIKDLHKIKYYAGSPAIIMDYLRFDDRAIFAELNEKDFAIFKKNFAGNDKFIMTREDGFALMKSKLPPRGNNAPKRGLVIIDPAFEKDQSKVSQDWQKIISALHDAKKRFAHATYLVWYPIIKGEEALLENFYQEAEKIGFDKMMSATFDIGAPENETKMTGCGMLIFNAPWQLDEKLNQILPQVLKILANADNAKFTLVLPKSS